jgi:peptidoglycan/LPS O-acetylase OafA/YrhL
LVSVVSDKYYLRGVIYGILLLGLSIAPLWLFVNRVTRFYGEISYSVYLNHPTLVFGLIPVYRSIYALHWRPTFQYGACLLLTLSLLTALSYCTYSFIEQPGIRLGKRLIKKVTQS